MSSTKEMVQWHPAMDACLQIEFEAERDKLSFEPEHLLGKKPMQIDELIIKVKKDAVIHKNIGQIFRGHNIVEYKNPDDNLTINDFYKTYGYCCFYQSDTEHVCEISPDDLTITFICNQYPYKMLEHLQKARDIQVVFKEKGIYLLNGDPIPMQLLITKELDKTENLWLASLRNDLKDIEEIEKIIRNYEKKKHSKLYQAAMNVITRANWEVIEEAKKKMCEALRELMAEEFQQEREVGEERGKKETEIQMISSAYKKLGDANKVAEILDVPVEKVKKIVQR